MRSSFCLVSFCLRVGMFVCAFVFCFFLSEFCDVVAGVY